MIRRGIRTIAGMCMAVSAAGCTMLAPRAALPPPAAPESGPVADGPDTTVPLSDCTVRQRDLTQPWDQRRYWCIPDPSGTPAPQAAAWAPAFPEIPAATLPAAFPDGAPAAAKPPPTAGLPASSVSGTAAAPERRTAATIPFAENILVLGPQGRARVRALLPAARAHCARVPGKTCLLLEGATLAFETNPSTSGLDELAVGRAIAVRAKLQQGGLDPARIKILFRDPGQAARRVEVLFHG